jgi:hypothetical protein
MKIFFKKPDEVFSPVNSQLIRKPVSSVCRKKIKRFRTFGGFACKLFSKYLICLCKTKN